MEIGYLFVEIRRVEPAFALSVRMHVLFFSHILELVIIMVVYGWFKCGFPCVASAGGYQVRHIP